jgi:hypothetical protein
MENRNNIPRTRMSELAQHMTYQNGHILLKPGQSEGYVTQTQFSGN